ncbi:ATP-binding protein [Tahibacter soli]|jgi:SpoVK/Ycf46/Vps4 family AAA+-type ATPase|uniref:ATP-binding protein n=1 Tax=Tahibacter soli TaxID=2983605 RepID=A0A9X3YSP4_9GAMM|nr:ATP-binding protein [Tahibacter soli]MDC8015691.1 ATP-binding protein [Tahibacter soli]
MQSDQLDALEQALAASPDNAPLLALALGACADASEWPRAERLLARAAPAARDALGPALKLRIASLAADWGANERALEYALGDDPAARLVRARALLDLGRRDEALAEYRAAIAANPTLEDPRLTAELKARVAPAGAERTVANDDTDRTEIPRLLKPEVQRVTFADVGGLDEIKQQIRRRIITPFQKPSLFERFRRRAGGGILMYGPPGCGKTLLARATAGECGAKFYNVALEDILDMYIGESERKLHAIFDEARRTAPSVLFFDEIEALGGKREHTREATSSKLISQFLAELDGFGQNNQGVLILGATNVPWAVDPAFRRPGRFDRVLFVPPPDQAAREDILKGLLRDRPTHGQIDVAGLARATSSFSGADLRHLVESAIDEAIDASLDAGREVPLTQEHLKLALDDLKPTTLEWLTTARNYARYANEGGQYDDVLDFIKRNAR